MADPLRILTDDNAGEAQQPSSESKALTISPAKPHHRSAEGMAERGEKLCGDFGGEKPDGTPCMTLAGQGTATRGEGRCYLHADEKLEDQAQVKKKFLEEFMKQPMTVRQASAVAGVSYMTILRYRKRDEGFDAECRAILAVVDQARAQFIEDSATLRAMDPTNTADTLRIFMMKNLMPGKYRDVYNSEHSGVNGGPIQTIQHNVRWNVDGNPIAFFAETEPREEIPLPPPREEP